MSNMSNGKYGLRIPTVKVGGVIAPQTFAIQMGDLLKSPIESLKANKAANEVLANRQAFNTSTVFVIACDKITTDGQPRSRETLEVTGYGIITRAEFIQAVTSNALPWKTEFANDATVTRKSGRGNEREKFLASLATLHPRHVTEVTMSSVTSKASKASKK